MVPRFAPPAPRGWDHAPSEKSDAMPTAARLDELRDELRLPPRAVVRPLTVKSVGTSGAARELLL
jgi:hypothetical protein